MEPLKLNITDDFLKEEIRCDYLIPSDMKKTWAIELDLLAEMLRVCKKHSIPIYSCGGTTLGAIRHEGFIPWDDDIDLMMFRKDYIKLCSIAEYEFQEPYFFQTEYTDPGCIRGHAQLHNSNTTAISINELEKKYSFNQGIFIDIFPLDNIPEDTKEFDRFIKKLNRKRTLARKYSKLTARYTPYEKNSIKKCIKKVGSKILPYRNLFYESFEKTMQKYNRKKCSRVGLLMFPRIANFCNWDIDDIGSPVYRPFEMLSIPVPTHAEKVLDQQYGDWHVFVKGDSYHSGMFFDTEKSYKEYIK